MLLRCFLIAAGLTVMVVGSAFAAEGISQREREALIERFTQQTSGKNKSDETSFDAANSEWSFDQVSVDETGGARRVRACGHAIRREWDGSLGDRVRFVAFLRDESIVMAVLIHELERKGGGGGAIDAGGITVLGPCGN